MADTTVEFGLLVGTSAPVCNYKAGDVIFREGDPAKELFVVKNGSVEIRLGNRLLDTLPERSIFGVALIDPGPRDAMAVAATDTTLVPVDEKQFLLMVGRTPYFALNVMPILERHLRASNSVVY
jgi:CRP/FNR family transcriptional regulator, cyclic AMP receptor protein